MVSSLNLKSASLFVLIGILSVALFAFAACASEEEPDEAAPAAPPAAPAAPTTAPAQPAAPTAAPAQPAPAMQESELGDNTLTLLVANVGATGGWDPTRTGGDEFMKVTRYYNCVLVSGGGGGILLPGVADSWSISSDGRTIDFVIADNIPAHDGSTIDLEDVWWRMEDRKSVV